MPQSFDVVCLGGGVAGEALAGGLRDSGLTLAVVERELVGGECPYWGCVPSKTLLRGEIVGELILAIKLRVPLNALADIIHPFPAFNRGLGSSLEQLAAPAAPHAAARS